MDPYGVVREFEQAVAKFACAPRAVAVESCTAAIFLSCKLYGVNHVQIPARTYPGVACSIIHAGGRIQFATPGYWQGVYQIWPYSIWDGALRFRPGMYTGGLHCLSFHLKKRIGIGRGGMILCETAEEEAWLKRARFDGRAEVPLLQDKFEMLGWNMYMTPEQAARGLQLLGTVRNYEDLKVEDQGYPDLSQFPIFQEDHHGKAR